MYDHPIPVHAYEMRRTGWTLALRMQSHAEPRKEWTKGLRPRGIIIPYPVSGLFSSPPVLRFRSSQVVAKCFIQRNSSEMAGVAVPSVKSGFSGEIFRNELHLEDAEPFQASKLSTLPDDFVHENEKIFPGGVRRSLETAPRFNTS